MNGAQGLGSVIRGESDQNSNVGGRRHLGHVQDASSHQLSGEPIQPLVEAHPTAGVTALDVPASPTAQLM